MSQRIWGNPARNFSALRRRHFSPAVLVWPRVRPVSWRPNPLAWTGHRRRRALVIRRRLRPPRRPRGRRNKATEPTRAQSGIDTSPLPGEIWPDSPVEPIPVLRCFRHDARMLLHELILPASDLSPRAEICAAWLTVLSDTAMNASAARSSAMAKSRASAAGISI